MSFAKIITLLWISFVFWTIYLLLIAMYVVFLLCFLWSDSGQYSCFISDIQRSILFLGIISLVFITIGFIWSKIVLVMSELIQGKYYSDMTYQNKFSNLSKGLSKITLWSIYVGLLVNTIYVIQKCFR